MGSRISYGTPPVVTDGLVLYLDAANRKSYPTTGTTWSDLSGYRINGTLTNGPTFSSANSGSIVFDGLNDYVDLGSNLFLNTSNPFTIFCWGQINAFTVNFPTLVSLKTNTNDFRIVYSTLTGYKDISFGAGSGWVQAKAAYTITTNNFINLILVYNGSSSTSLNNYSLYINGLSVAISNANTFSTSNVNNTIGNQLAFASHQFNGKIAQVGIYNRALTTSEVQQNYNALKGRYNL